ncbi:MAG: DUF2179 domain-containing protein [candidate division KSB1 bacterium]|nr:DUF2179 domain-containing protein [candidate division KSB1 bacterium]
MQETIFATDFGRWVLLPALIFLARVSDVSIGTIRIIFVSRGQKLLAPLLGFFEIMIWLLAIGQIMHNLSNFLCVFAYAAGFSTGNLVGIWIEKKLAVGKVLVRIITQKGANNLVESLREHGFGATHIPAEGSRGPVSVIYSIINRKDIYKIYKMINHFNPKSFYTIEDIRELNYGIFPERISLAPRLTFMNRIRSTRIFTKHKEK